jgi:ankyrin repeat protein
VASVDWLPSNTPLHVASRNGHTEIVKLLLEKGADVNITSAGCKIETGCKAEVSIVDSKSRTALQLASEQGHTETMNLLEMAHNQNTSSWPIPRARRLPRIPPSAPKCVSYML